MKECPHCGSPNIYRHCHSFNQNCDLIRCASCNGYGNHRRFTFPIQKNRGKEERQSIRFET